MTDYNLRDFLLEEYFFTHAFKIKQLKKYSQLNKNIIRLGSP